MKTKLLLMFLFLTITLQAQTNLVPNGNFENWTSSSQPDNWFRSLSGGLVFQSNSAQNGSSSIKMQNTNGTFNYINSDFFPVIAGKTYLVTMYHKLVKGTFSAIDLSLYHKPDTFKSEITKKTDAVTTSTEWRKIQFYYTPTISEPIEIDIWTTGSLNSEILVDNVSVVDVATISSAFTLIPDLNFERKLIELKLDSGAPDGKVLTEDINKIKSLNVSFSSIKDLTGIQNFVSLNALYCDVNQLTTLDLSKNVALVKLECDINNLTTLELSKNVALKELICYRNQLTTLDLSKNIALTELRSFENNLTTLDLSKNVYLTYLYCSSNQLTALDLSKNFILNTLDCSNNPLLSSLNLKNGQNHLIDYNKLNLKNNPLLNCITVDDVTVANSVWKNNKEPFAIYSPYDCSLVTQIPDPNFENKLIALGIDTDGKNGVVLNSSIVSLISLNVSNSSIVDLKGIEGFKALTTLDCSKNRLKKIDLSKNTTINTLNCSNNLLEKLDLSKNTTINTLNCSINPSLSCIQVADIAAAEKWATTKDANVSFSLDCTKYTLIPDTKFEDKLIALGIDKDGKNGKVATESIADITQLDVSSSSITDLQGIQDFVDLDLLVVTNNQLKTLDLSGNVSLDHLFCENNQLTMLDISRNTILSVLNYSSNKLTTLDLSRHTSLRVLNCSSNQVTTLDISKNMDLTELYCSSNKLTTLDLSRHTNLRALNCSSNQLTTLDISKNVSFLKEVNCSSNKLTTLDVSKNVFLKELSCSSNQLTTLDLSKNMYVTYLDCSSNQLTTLDLTKKLDLTELYCSSNKLTTLDLSKNAYLKKLNCSNNQLTILNLKNGYNKLFLEYLLLKNNPNLTCIQVDSRSYADDHWFFSKDATASYSESCANLSTSDVIFEKLNVYPNPTKGALFIENVSVNNLRIYDGLGKQVNVPFSSNGTSTTANLEQFPKGIYYMYIESEGETTVRKVIVE
nr:T9SS type A sorting domain-containing protein [uncultured Flavobacterium sp.]